MSSKLTEQTRHHSAILVQHNHTCIVWLLLPYSMCLKGQRVMWLVTFCLCVCVTKNLRLHTYQAHVFAKWCILLTHLLYNMSPEMFARSIESYRECYSPHLSFYIQVIVLWGTFESLQLNPCLRLEIVTPTVCSKNAIKANSNVMAVYCNCSTELSVQYSPLTVQCSVHTGCVFCGTLVCHTIVLYSYRHVDDDQLSRLNLSNWLYTNS